MKRLPHLHCVGSHGAGFDPAVASATSLYWTDAGTIYRANPEGFRSRKSCAASPIKARPRYSRRAGIGLQRATFRLQRLFPTGRISGGESRWIGAGKRFLRIVDNSRPGMRLQATGREPWAPPKMFWADGQSHLPRQPRWNPDRENSGQGPVIRFRPSHWDPNAGKMYWTREHRRFPAVPAIQRANSRWVRPREDPDGQWTDHGHSTGSRGRGRCTGDTLIRHRRPVCGHDHAFEPGWFPGLKSVIPGACRLPTGFGTGLRPMDGSTGPTLGAHSAAGRGPASAPGRIGSPKPFSDRPHQPPWYRAGPDAHPGARHS